MPTRSQSPPQQLIPLPPPLSGTAAGAAGTSHKNVSANPSSQPPPLPTEILSYHDGYEAQNGTVVQYHSEWTKQHQLEGDGLLPLLYDHLWKSDRTREHRLREALIPDTVVFEHNFPRAWYTYDMKTQELVKRAGKLLDSASIYRHFCGGDPRHGASSPDGRRHSSFTGVAAGAEESLMPASSRPRGNSRVGGGSGRAAIPTGGCDIVAQFYYRSVTVPLDHHQQRYQRYNQQSSPSGSGRSSPRRGAPRDGDSHRHHHYGTASDREPREELTTAVEYFTKETLYDFLHNRKVKPDGVLQKFLIPKGESSARHNFQIQAVWSPLVTLVYKRTNKHRLNDKTTPVPERAATFDGLAHLSSESLVAEGTKARVDELCKTIAKHFFVTEHKQITRLVVYFKVDDLDRIWILWASSLRIGSDKLNPSYLRVPMQLAMRVESVNGGSSRDEVHSARRQMQRELVDRDVTLYNLTGDWAFASQCAQKFAHDARVEQQQHQAQQHSPSSETRTNNNNADDVASSSANQIKKAPHPPAPLTIATVSSSARPGTAPQTPSFVPVAIDGISGFDLSSLPRYRGLSTYETGSVASGSRSATSRHHLRNTQHVRQYISPRAPFLPTQDKQYPTDVASAAHPLHEAYLVTHPEVADKVSAGTGSTAAENTGTSLSRNPTEFATARSARNGASTSTIKALGGNKRKVATSAAAIRKTPAQRVEDGLYALALDVVYDAYSLAMEGGPKPTAPATPVQFSDELTKCLSPDELLTLGFLLRLEPNLTPPQTATGGSDNPSADALLSEFDGTPESAAAMGRFLLPSGAVTRGRRQDRPVAQIAEDVRDFFHDLFQNENTAHRLVATWEATHL